MTLRQITLYHREALRHEARAMADTISAHGLGAAASQTREGAQAARRTVDQLRCEAEK